LKSAQDANDYAADFFGESLRQSVPSGNLAVPSILLALMCFALELHRKRLSTVRAPEDRQNKKDGPIGVGPLEKIHEGESVQ
jgi:hypothetical protein